MKKNYIYFLLTACFLMVTSISFGQLKFGDKSSVGQTLTLDNELGVATVNLSFNTDKSASSATLNADSVAAGVDYYNISIKKCSTNKGFQANVLDESDAAIVNDDFKCRRYNSYENPVRVSSVESLKKILSAYAVNDASTTSSLQKPAHCLFDIVDPVTYDFKDKVIYDAGKSDDGVITLVNGVQYHGDSYGLDMKTGSQLEIIVSGNAEIAFLGSVYSSLSMKATAKNSNGSFELDSISSIVENDKVDYFTFNYTGTADTLVFTAVADGGGQDSDIYLPQVIITPESTDQAFGAWPGKYKKVEYGFNVKFDGSAVENDITFTIDTYDEGNTGSTASYELTVYIGGTDVSNLVATVPDFYVTGSGLKEVSLASAAGLSPSDFSSKNVYWFLKTTGTGTTIADDSFDPIIIIDNMIVKYNPPAWAIPAAGITANQTLATTVEGVVGDTLFSVPLKTAARLGSLNIINDLQDKTTKPFATFLAEGALMANDGNGNYTVPVDYTLTPSTFNESVNEWSKASISIAAPNDGAVSDDMMFFFKARVVAGRTMTFRLELDHGTRIWYDINIKDTPPIVEEGTFYNIIQKNTGLAFGGDIDGDGATQPAIMTATGGNDQAFEFIAVPDKNKTYYIRNKDGMYFNKSTSNNWTTIFEAETNGSLSEWIVNGEDMSSVTFQIVANIENISESRSYISTDEETHGANLYCDKGAQAVGSSGEFMLQKVVIIKDECFEPYYAELENLVPDPTGDDISLWNGWGLKSIVTADSTYCGAGAILLSDPTGDDCNYPDGDAALDVSNFAWAPNTTYHLRAMVKTIDGPIGFLARGSIDNGDGDVGFAIDTEGEWMQLDTMFTTSENPSSGFFSFNTCDFSSTATSTYIDNYELYALPADTIINVAYATDRAAADPISAMLHSDDHIQVDLVDGTGDYSDYDVVIGQESFASGDAVWAPNGSLNLRNSVPMIMNKNWAWKSGKPAITSDASVDRIADVSVMVETANQSNELFSGITFTDGSIELLGRPTEDPEGDIGLDVLNGLAISGSSTLLASASNVADAAKAIVINDIPAGTQIGNNTEDVTGARIIAFCMNYANLTDSTNISPENMTIWRNAVYILGGMTPPTNLVANEDYIPNSTKELVLEGVNIYPNPVENNLTITGLEQNAQISIISTVGQVISREVANSSKISINTTNLKEGIYMLKVELNGKHSISRFVKK